MIDFYNGIMADIMPDNFKSEPVVQAISYAISNMIKKIIDMSQQISVYSVIDILDEQIVDLLAVELRTQYYSDFLTLDEKREMIKKTLLWYYRAGTLSTVRELTDFVYENAKIEEWFQYGSSAFLFRIIIQVLSQDITLEKYNKYLQSLNEVKNTRSHLEAVIFKYNTKTEIKTLAAAGLGSIVKVKARVVKKVEIITDNRPVAALFVNQNILVKNENEIKGEDAYVLSSEGKKVRVLTSAGEIIKIRKKESF